VPYTSFPAPLQARLRNLLTSAFVSGKLLSTIGVPLPGEAGPGGWDLLKYVQYDMYQISSAMQQAGSLLAGSSVTVFFGPAQPHSFGFSISLGGNATQLTGAASPLGLSLTFYRQLWDVGSGASNG
jgi:hypothetical protein